MKWRFEKIVSGGQTGVDRAALDVALELGMPCGGWCPKGRKAEGDPIPSHYPLMETPSEEYVQRTEWNVRDSDGTLVLTRGEPTGGTAQTIEIAIRLGKPCMVINLEKHPRVSAILDWARKHKVRTLNVAGPRESKSPGIFGEASRFLQKLFKSLKSLR
ncbi:MAG: molybdenum cofactor carrier [Candidatus Fraserbacteria bacterium RBG_16_55_9]|uniref:Molybdenum cofactor carrier n=1 Tax=Fraserbacteria sp. (strain RBG_16_55_9) TaxID=1817864 RepID=A0A1F5UWD3_FRAXR|nr:MAG: molybdenum cofactor carrier [Candidatus Fraserbacteria bacterium RBG_16_55_9]